MSISKGKTARTQAAPKTTVKRDPALPFISRTFGPRGAWLGTNMFDPPAGSIYAEGHLYGLDAAKTLLAAVVAGDPNTHSIAIKEIFAAADHESKSASLAKMGAAHAFLDVVTAAFKFAAKNGSWHRYFEHKASVSAGWIETEKKHEANRTQRSIEARRAKQAARKAAKVEGGEDASA